MKAIGFSRAANLLRTKKTVTATLIVVMSKGDIAKKQAAEHADGTSAASAES